MVLDLAREFRARVRLVSPRLARARLTGLFLPDALPEEVRAAFGAPPVPAYQGMAPFWEEHWSSVVPRYGDYVATLRRTGRLEGRGALDLACGSGIAAAAMAPHFRRVHAIDRSPHLLAQARARLASFPHATCQEGSFQDFALPEPVELVVCAGNSLNYALTPGALDEAFAAVRRALVPGGRFLFDLQGEGSFRGNSGKVFRYRLGGHEWWHAWSYDPASGLDDARCLTAMGVEHHRRRFIGPGEVQAAAARAGLRSTGRLRHPLLRGLARLTGWDFYELEAPRSPSGPPSAPPRW